MGTHDEVTEHQDLHEFTLTKVSPPPPFNYVNEDEVVAPSGCEIEQSVDFKRYQAHHHANKSTDSTFVGM